MRTLASLAFWFLSSALIPGAEPSTSQVFKDLLARHQEIKSYFAVYEGEAPGGKTVTAAISFDGPSGMASVHTQFSINGKVVAAPMQAITPELGIVMSGQDAIQLKDAPLILAKLSEIAGVLFGDKQRPLGTWSPALSMTQTTMAAQLSITTQPQMPWLHEELPKGTTHIVDGDSIVFTTPEGCVSRVQSATGILERQNFPNNEGDRTLVLKELQTDLSPSEVSRFISSYLPTELEVQPMGQHSLLTHIQHQMFRELVAEIDDGALSYSDLERNLLQAKPLFADYFNAIYPPESFLKGDEKGSDEKAHPAKLSGTVQSAWEKFGGMRPEGLLPKTDDGEKAARLIVASLEDELTTFFKNKAK